MSDYIRRYKSPRYPLERKEAERVAAAFEKEAEVVRGVVRWKSNGRVPPRDILEFWKWLGKEFHFANSLRALEEETERDLEAYRANHHVPTAEQRAEARAAYGPGVRLINVFTGKIYTT